MIRAMIVTRPTVRRLVLLAALWSCGLADAQTLLGVSVAGTPRPDAALPGPVDPEIAELVALARRTRTAQTGWAPGKPLADARNAHSTNTREQMKDALERDRNFLEADVRQEINPPHELEMRHDEGQERGDNLTVRQWLAIGVASGRGLKLDVKEARHMPRLIDEIAAAGVPAGLLMFSLGFDSADRWGARLRARFPQAWIAINSPSHEDELTPSGIEAMLALGRRIGGPITFIVYFDSLTLAKLNALKPGGPVSIWNSRFAGTRVEDPAAVTRSLERMGVDGVVDIRPSAGLVDYVGLGLGWAAGKLESFAGNF